MSLDPRVEHHLAHWQQVGLLSDAQVAELRAASPPDRAPTATAAVPWVRWALVVLGGGLLLAGLILVMAENWARVPAFGKLGGWLAIYLSLLALVQRAGRVTERPLIAESLAFVAGGWLFGGIALVSQIYHLNSRPANGFWFWLALALPLCWALPWRAMTLVVFVALVSALTAEVAAADGWLAATSALGPWLWLLIPCLAAGAVSFLPQPAQFLPNVLGFWWVVVSQLFLLFLGGEQILDRSDLGAAWWVAGLGLGVTLAWPRRVLPAAWSGLESRAIVVLSLLPWVLLGEHYEIGDGLDVIAIGVSWVTQLAVAFLLIRAGAASRRALWVNLGFLAILAGLVVRYFDWFGEYLEGGAMLALTGVLILVIVGALERQRRRTLTAGAEP
ncbi:MAG: DUF2157 domain-containing protein [Thermoanaerobaculia bacterium]|nr:DUF2157 domain-containing protein [Thermoanaerobaculia bacterium]